MTTYATNNPVGSMDPKDLFDNAQNLDFALNTITQTIWKDRLGRNRKTYWGIEQAFSAQLLSQQQRFNNFIQSSGYKVIGEYTDGPLTISEYNQLIRYNNELWKLSASTNIPFTTTGKDAASWVSDSTHLVSVGDAVLRQQLAAPNGFDLIGGRKKFVILATGQSNAQQEPAYSWEPPPNIFVWEWPGLNTTGTRFIPCPADKINHTYACAAQLARLNPTWQVYVIRIASGGRPIEHWLPGGSATTLPEWNAYADCKNNTEKALSILGLNKIDYMHWHQGESNIEDGSLYIAKWNNMFNRFVGETWFDTNTSVLVNGITSQAIKGDVRYKTQNLMLKQIVTSRPWQRALIPTAEIVPADMWLSDGMHMSAEGHELLGRAEADMLVRGIATQVTRGYIYSEEDGTVCIGGANPAAGGVLEINRGSNLDGTSKNARTSLDVINTQTGSSDIASYRLIGANGTYSVTSYGVGALTNSVRMEWTGSSQYQMAVTTGGAFTQYAGSTEILRCAVGVLRPGTTDNAMSLGTASNRFSQVYAAIGSINTSDGREKTTPLAIDDKALDAWSEVPIITFQWLEAIRLKGEDSARWHFGVI
uniref:sialate O-acetylesterase n=1 Tax=Escherichia coli TaxID=562 RepID=UPI001572A8BF